MEQDISSLEPFVCKICDESVKNERNVILRHIKRTHGIKWKKYVENYVKNNNFLQQSDDDESGLVKKHKSESKKMKYKTKKGKSVKTRINETFVDVQNINEEVNLVDDQEDILKPCIKTTIDSELSGETTNPLRKETLSEEVKGKTLSVSMKTSFKVNNKVMNVTDRNMKTCVKCDIDFPSRLRFIRHCQMAHKMKFKLKNGDKLTLP